MKASLLKTIRQGGSENRRNRINYKIITFLVCLAISCFLWIMNMLSKKYTETISFHLEYKNIPKNKNLSPATSLMNVKVTSSGYDIAAYTFGIKGALLNIDASQFRHRGNYYFYSLDNKEHIEKIEDQLGENMRVVEVDPDTLYLQPPQEQN